jgi:hypothetical protein
VRIVIGQKKAGAHNTKRVNQKQKSLEIEKGNMELEQNANIGKSHEIALRSAKEVDKRQTDNGQYEMSRNQ